MEMRPRESRHDASRARPEPLGHRAAAMEKILTWDFDRVIVCHGEVLETGGREALREGYRWLLES